jgi:phage-related baseplate assembly protein
MLTALIGCTCTNSKSLVGQDEETNAHYLQRCQAKLGTLSPNGPESAYLFIAESILDPTQPFYNAGLSQSITKVTVLSGPALVQVYVANADGAPSGGDVAIVNSVLQAWADPSGTTLLVAGATNVVIPVTATVYVPAAKGYSSGQVQTDISDDIATYFESVPIGGLTDASAGVLPLSAIIGVIWGAVPGLTAVTMGSPSADTPIGPTQVALLGTVTISVVFT